MRKRKFGFTLVELLVVLSIIAMFMGILMPALAAARRTAYRTMCKENLHGCALAFRMYLDDNKNIMPIIYNMPNFTSHEDASLYIVLKKYISGPEALKCPADKYPDKNSTYFREEGSSYKYNYSLCGVKIEDSGFAKRFGINEVWILRDYSPFHGKPDRADSTMYLYGDTLVADRERDK